jgi:flagellar protein FliS
MDGALDRLAIAKGHMQRREVPQKVNAVNRTMSIIDGLRMSLDHNIDPAMSDNLENLYDYMNRRLLLANINNDIAGLDEVSSLLRELKEAWDAIPNNLQSAESSGEALGARSM